MGKINFYTVRSLFKGDPKTLPQLRDAQQSKLAQYKEKGSFVFTMEADDRQPALVISWSGDADNKDYWKSVVKAPKQIKGTFAGNTKAKSYVLTADDGSKALLAEYLKVKDNGLSIALWNLIGPEGNLLSINGTPLSRRTLSDEKWVLASWDVTRILVTDKTLFDVAPLGKTLPVTDGKHKGHALPNGLWIPDGITFEVEVFGKMAQKALANDQNWAYFRKDVADVFKDHVGKLAADLVKLDQSIGKEKDVAKKLKLVEQGNARVEKFLVDAEKAVLESATKQWIKFLEAKVDYRDFQVDMTIKITRGVITFAVGATAAGLGGITGVGAVLGLVGVIKGGLETTNTIYTAFRDVDGLGNELNVTLARALSETYAAGWRDFGKTALQTLPGGPVVISALARGGLAVKPVKTLKEDLKNYNGKVSGLIKKASDLGAKVKETVAKSDAALKALDVASVKEIEKNDPRVKTRNDLLRKKIGQVTTDFLDKIGDLTRRFDEGKEKVESYAKMIETLEKKVNEDVFATVLRDVFTPLLNLPWGMNPENLANTIISASSVTLEVVTPLVNEFTKDEEGGDAAKEWATSGLELTKGLRELVEAVNKLKGG